MEMSVPIHQRTMTDIQNFGVQVKSEESQKQFGDISLELDYQSFKAHPVFKEVQKLEDLPAFLVGHGAHITKLSYIERKGKEKLRQLILKHCPNISQVKFEFTKYRDEVDDDNSQLMVKFLTALAPGLSSLETINNERGLHYLSCMGFVYENFSNKIKFVKTDELKPEELSVLTGDNNNDNPALSLEELIFADNDFLCIHRKADVLALKPESLTDLVKLKNLRRIELPFLLTKKKIPSVTTLPLLDYASLRLLTNKERKPSTSSFIKNIGIALANIRELKLYGFDPGLMVLNSILKSCNKLEILHLTELRVGNDYYLCVANLTGIKLNFKQLDAEIMFSHLDQIYLILYLIENVLSLTKINIVRIGDKKIMDKFIAASISLAQKVQHDVELHFEWSRSSCEEDETKVPKEPPTIKPDNLKIAINVSD